MAPRPHRTPNPFRISGVVAGKFFTDRADESRRIERALTSPADKLLLFGLRRMGKTSTLDRAIERLAAKKQVAFRADLAGATTVTDLANRILHAATRALGRRWQDMAADLFKSLQIKVAFTPDPTLGGFPLPTLSAELRAESLEEQRANLGQVLDMLDALAAARRISIGVVLDEFQTIHRFGGESAEWHFRGVIQNHQHLSYVAAGSEVTLIEAMQGHGRAFYDLFEVLHFGPMNPAHFARWLDERLTDAGLRSGGFGTQIVAIAGPRTRDIVELARSVYEVATAEGRITAATLEEAFRQIVAAKAESFRAPWEELPAAQQNVLRAIAADEAKLYGRDTLQRFGLKSSAEVAQAMGKLHRRELIAANGDGATIDNPFFRGWLIASALPDVGIVRPLLPPIPPSSSRSPNARSSAPAHRRSG